MRISCPPTISSCYYGVDTPSKNQLIAANKSVDEIREYIHADSLAYLSLEGLRKAAGEGDDVKYCTACYTGKYPTNSWMSKTSSRRWPRATRDQDALARGVGDPSPPPRILRTNGLTHVLFAKS